MNLGSSRSRAVKRLMDLVLTVPVLIVSLPVQAIVAIAVKISSPGPALYRARRVGRNGREFTMFKFRSMRVGLDGPRVTGASDGRITPVGRFLRRTKFDELPQLAQVVVGQMSLVGRRPEDPRYVALYTQDQRRVFKVPPAITGPAMEVDEEARLAGLAPEDVERVYVEELMPAKLEVELSYLDSWSPVGDLRILVATLLSLLPHFRSRHRPNPAYDG